MRINDSPLTVNVHCSTFVPSLLLILVLSAPLPAAQSSNFDPYPLQPPDTSSPRDTLQGFLTDTARVIKAWRRNEFDSRIFRYFVNASEVLDFSTTPESEAFSVKIERMLFLKEILDRVELPPTNKIPGDNEVKLGRVTKWTIPHTRITIARIEDGPRAGEFLFSAATVRQLDAFYRLARNLPYKATATTPGAYEAWKASGGSVEFERLLRQRLKKVDTSSPQSTLAGFLESINRAYALVMDTNAKLKANPPAISRDQALKNSQIADNFLDRAIDTLDLSQVPEAHRQDSGLEAALQLKEVLDRVPLPFLEAIPDAQTIKATRKRASGSSSPAGGAYRWQYPNTEIEFVEITEGERKGEFLFSANTVKRAGEFYRKVSDLPYRGEFRMADYSNYEWAGISKGFYEYYISTPGHLIAEARLFGRLIDHLPAWFQTRFGGEMAWQWLAVFIVALVTAALGILVFRLTKRFAEGLKSPLNRWTELLAPALAGVIVEGCVEFLDSEANITGTLLISVRACGNIIVTVLVVWSVVRLCRAIGESLAAAPQVRELRIDANLVRIGMSVIAFLAGSLIIIYSLKQLGADMVPLLAGLGVGGLAIALAAQRTFANFIGSLILFANKPVQVGDFCRYGDQIGTVEYIGLLSTRIRSLERTIVTVPNAEFSEMKLDNFTKRDMRLFKTVLQLRYETTAEQMRYILAKLREMLLAHPKVLPAPARVRLVGYGAYSKDLEVFAYLDCQDQDTFLAMQEDVLLRMEDIIAEAGSGFAFPSQTTYLSRDSGLDAERQDAAEAQVDEWRERGKLPFPEFDDQEREHLKGILDYPPKGSPHYALPTSPTYAYPGGDSSTLSAEDLADLPSLVAKLRGNDRLAKRMISGLSDATRKLLSAYDGGTDPVLKDALVNDLNAIICGSLIYEPESFSKVSLTVETQELLALNPKGENLQRLNRLLLQDAYPAELSRRASAVTY